MCRNTFPSVSALSVRAPRPFSTAPQFDGLSHVTIITIYTFPMNCHPVNLLGSSSGFGATQANSSAARVSLAALTTHFLSFMQYFYMSVPHASAKTLLSSILSLVQSETSSG